MSGINGTGPYVESVIGMRPDGFGNKEYLVKWKGLEIDQATWEPQKEIEEKYAYLIQAYL